MDFEERVNVHLNNCFKLLQGRCGKDSSQVANATNIATTCMEKGILKRLNYLAARLQNAVDEALTTAKKRMSLRKVKVMCISK